MAMNYMAQQFEYRRRPAMTILRIRETTSNKQLMRPKMHHEVLGLSHLTHMSPRLIGIYVRKSRAIVILGCAYEQQCETVDISSAPCIVEDQDGQDCRENKPFTRVTYQGENAGTTAEGIINRIESLSEMDNNATPKN